jgi:hypothetical protein
MPREDLADYNEGRGKDLVPPPTADNRPGF